MYLTNSLLVFINCITISLTNNNNFSDFNYEKMHRFGLGRRLIPDYRRINPRRNFGFDMGQHPQPLPEPKTPYIAGPWHSIFQGKRRKGDYRAFNNKFEHAPDNMNGQRYRCEAALSCKITHLAMRTDAATPILLRGGVGYRHFYAIARAPAGTRLNGSVSAYCMGNGKKKMRYQYGLIGREGDYYMYDDEKKTIRYGR